MLVIYSLLKFGRWLLDTSSSLLDTFLRWFGSVLSRFALLEGNTRKRVTSTLLLVLLSGLIYAKCGRIGKVVDRSVQQTTGTSASDERISSSISTLGSSRGATTLSGAIGSIATRYTSNAIRKYAEKKEDEKGQSLPSKSLEGEERNGFTKKVGFQAILIPQRGFGADLQVYQFRSWGLNFGCAYFPSDRKANETVSASWNLKGLTKVTENTSLIVVGSFTRKGIMGGLKINL